MCPLLGQALLWSSISYRHASCFFVERCSLNLSAQISACTTQNHDIPTWGQMDGRNPCDHQDVSEFLFIHQHVDEPINHHAGSLLQLRLSKGVYFGKFHVVSQNTKDELEFSSFTRHKQGPSCSLALLSMAQTNCTRSRGLKVGQGADSRLRVRVTFPDVWK